MIVDVCILVDSLLLKFISYTMLRKVFWNLTYLSHISKDYTTL